MSACVGFCSPNPLALMKLKKVRMIVLNYYGWPKERL